MKLSHARGATQDRQVMVERSDRMWSTGEGNGKPLQYSCLENTMNGMKRQNDRILKGELPGSIGAQFALIHGPNIPGSYAILLFTASDHGSITSHICNWVLFLLWLHPFLLSGVFSTDLL